MKKGFEPITFPTNGLQAILSADLNLSMDEVVRLLPDFPKEDWAEYIEEGIEKASYLSITKIDQMLAHPEFNKWIRFHEALAARPEIQIRHAEKIMEIVGPEEPGVIRRLLCNTSIDDRDFQNRLFEMLRKWEREDYASLGKKPENYVEPSEFELLWPGRKCKWTGSPHLFTLTTKTLAAEAGVVKSRIRQLSPELEKTGLAMKDEKGTWKFKPEAVKWVEEKPSSRKKKKT